MEEIGELIRKGFSIWKSNLNLCKPFLYSLISWILIVISFSIVIYAAHIPLALTDAYKYWGLEWHELLPGWILLLVAIIIIWLIGLFSNAGAIGMARQVLVSSRLDTSSMWSAAKRHFWNIFLLNLLNGLIIGLAMLVGLVLIILLPGMEQLMASTEIPESPEMLGTLLAAAIVFVLCLLPLAALTPTTYALVLEDLGPIAALRGGIDFFRENKADVLILWIVAGSLYWAAQIIGAGLIAILAQVLVLAPLTNLWWTRLYMVRKGMLNEEDAKDPHQLASEAAIV